MYFGLRALIWEVTGDRETKDPLLSLSPPWDRAAQGCSSLPFDEATSTTMLAGMGAAWERRWTMSFERKAVRRTLPKRTRIKTSCFQYLCMNETFLCRADFIVVHLILDGG